MQNRCKIPNFLEYILYLFLIVIESMEHHHICLWQNPMEKLLNIIKLCGKQTGGWISCPSGALLLSLSWRMQEHIKEINI